MCINDKEAKERQQIYFHSMKQKWLWNGYFEVRTLITSHYVSQRFFFQKIKWMKSPKITSKFLPSCRKSCSQVFFKIVVLKNFAIFTVKQLCWSVFLSKVTLIEQVTLSKKTIQHRCFPVHFTRLKSTYYMVHLQVNNFVMIKLIVLIFITLKY